ncbi:MAG TPA: hypothetical protein VM529_24320 [Gemmata sp.]|nr:hypothetical protein [Gemmata sp.]
MTARDFCYWLQGFFEIRDASESQAMNSKQVELVKRHLAMVFAHDIDPKAGDVATQGILDKIHSPGVYTTSGTPRC